jgi:5-methylcytosine-specific restriction protein A
LDLRNPPDLLRTVLRLTHTDARRRVRAAERLTPDRDLLGQPLPPDLPGTAAAVAAGTIGEEHVRILDEAMRALPRGTDPDTAARVEEALAQQAPQFPPEDLRGLCRAVLGRLDPDGPEPDEPDPTPAKRGLWWRPQADGSTRLTGTLDAEGAATVAAALRPLAGRRPDPTGTCPDERTQAQRDHDALVELARQALDQGDLSQVGGQAPHVAVTIDWDVLRQAAGQDPMTAAILDTGATLHPATLRKLACDAGILPVVLAGGSRILDTGREHRLATLAIRQALAIRDRGCAFPACDRAPAHCQVHHIRPWSHGGDTSLANTTLLCAFHHTRVHQAHYTIRFHNGQVEFHPPEPLRGILPSGSNPVRHLTIQPRPG